MNRPLYHYILTWSLVSVFGLKSILSDISIVIPALFWFLLAWNIFFHHFTWSTRGPCDRSLKSEVPCGSCLSWRWGPLPMHQAQWSPPFEYPGSVGAGPRQVATEQGPQEAILKELSRHEPRNQQAISMELSSDESCCSTGNNQARDQAGITQLCWQLSSRWADRNHAQSWTRLKRLSSSSSSRPLSEYVYISSVSAHFLICFFKYPIYL